MRYQFEGMPLIRMNLMLWNLYIAEPLSSAEVPAQPRPQGFSLKKMGGAPHPFFEGKALGTRLVPAGYPNKNRYNTSYPPPRFLFFSQPPCDTKRPPAEEREA